MIKGLVGSLFGGGETKFKRRHRDTVAAINRHGEELKGAPLDRLAARIGELRAGAENEPKPGSGDELASIILPEVFALVREAAEQTIGLRHFDVQLLGGVALAKGMIAEMKTGEGKTLVATLAAVLASVRGLPAHVVTVNDYLAARDANWMRPVYQALGLEVGINISGLDRNEKRKAYEAAVTYGTNSQFGFDYLNDNMIGSSESRLQRGLGLAIVDEVDSILIDEARTPLAISGPAADLTPLYLICNEVAQQFARGTETDGVIEGDFAVDERNRQVLFSDVGYDKAERIFSERKMLHDGGLYEAHNLNLMHHLIAALRAHHIYKKDHEYVVRNNKVVIVDEHSGRLMPGRRWGDGLHQALEAKEKMPIEPETQTFASVTLQNFYRLYSHLAGMTGTAKTEAEEFNQIYGLEVAEIPTHRSMVRTDNIDLVFARRAAKLNSVVDDIADCSERGQPVLVGTTSIESSEELAAKLTEKKIKFDLLNAKHHEREAEIIAQAGVPGKVTISTSMAGRGTDIVLGGNLDSELEKLAEDESQNPDAKAKKREELEKLWQQRHDQAVAAGGLRVIGTERHESRRIDNQLRGRSGRQGDPGSSIFYLSFEDPLLRAFTDQRFGGMIEKLMEGDDAPLEAGMVSRVIEKAQRRVESHYFDIRKQLLEYDDIANDQRLIIYEQRRDIVDSDEISDVTHEFARSAIEAIMAEMLSPNAPEEEWQIEEASDHIKKNFGVDAPITAWLEQDEKIGSKEIGERATKLVVDAMLANLDKLGDNSKQVQKGLILEVIDGHWRNHLAALDHLRQGIGLRGFAQKNPKQEYRREAVSMFNAMLDSIRLEATRILLAVRLRQQPVEPAPSAAAAKSGEEPSAVPRQAAAAASQVSVPPGIRPQSPEYIPSVGRNEPCPCGSGKKYKHCHGRGS